MAAVALAEAFPPQKLRVGLFADARLQPRWVAEAFRTVARSDCAEIVALGISGAAPGEPRYGAGIALNRVLRLTPDAYAERQVERIVPPPESGLLGLHTVNRAGELTVVDALARRRRI